MFREKYKKAYAGIEPEKKLFERVMEMAETTEKKNSLKTGEISERFVGRFMKPVLCGMAGILTVMTLLSLIAVPALAENVPEVYRFLEGISVSLADWFVPIEESCTKSGITMQVEAVYVQDNKAELYVSFCDAENSDKDMIHGPVDMFDSYGMVNLSAGSVMGGCYYMGFDEENGKAYFKVTTQADTAFETEKMTFYVRELLCNVTKEERAIDLTETVTEADIKIVDISGCSISKPENMHEDVYQFLEKFKVSSESIWGDPRPDARVLKMKPVSECAANDFTVTGIAYLDGILRVQICMGDNSHADRHVQPFLVDNAGNERHQDASISWHEEYEGVRYQFYEFFFAGPFENPADYSMYGIFHDTTKPVNGNWSVTFRLEE